MSTLEFVFLDAELLILECPLISLILVSLYLVKDDSPVFIFQGNGW